MKLTTQFHLVLTLRSEENLRMDGRFRGWGFYYSHYLRYIVSVGWLMNNKLGII
jgi:hypothetical protein